MMAKILHSTVQTYTVDVDSYSLVKGVTSLGFSPRRQRFVQNWNLNYFVEVLTGLLFE